MKNAIIIGSLALCSVLTSEAAIIAFTGANTQAATVNNGILGSITEPMDNSVLNSLSYTVSGLTIDSDGMANDTVTFTIAISALGGGNIIWDTNDGGIREFDYDNTTFNAAGEGIDFGTIAVSGISSGGLSYALDSGLYNQATFRRFTTDTVGISGSSTNFTAVNNVNQAMNDTSFSIALNVGNWNL